VPGCFKAFRLRLLALLLVACDVVTGKHPANIHHSVEAFQLLVVLVFLLCSSAAISRFTTSNPPW